MSQGIQERTPVKSAEDSLEKKIEVIGLLRQIIKLQIF